MGFNINQARKSGFTIVELLIVVVVIAILAAITIVSYNGITTTANASAAKSTASTVGKKIESYQALEGSYPITPDELVSSSDAFHLTSGFLGAGGSAFLQTGLNSDIGKNTVIVRKCGSGTPANQAAITSANVTGVQILIWDYEGTGAAAGTLQTSLGVTTGDGIACPTTQGD